MSETREQELAQLSAEQAKDSWRAVSLGQLKAGVPSHSDPRYLWSEAEVEDDEEGNGGSVGASVDILGQRLGGDWRKSFGWEPALDQVGDAIEWQAEWSEQPDEIFLVEVWERVQREAAEDLLVALYGSSPLVVTADGHRPLSRRELFKRWLAKYLHHPELTAEGRDVVIRDTIVLWHQALGQYEAEQEIVRQHERGESERKLAAKYGVSRRFVRQLSSDDEPGEEEEIGMLTQEQAAEMLQLLRKIDRNTELQRAERDLQIFLAGAQAQSEIDGDLEDVE